VGLRSAAQALEMVQRAFAGALARSTVDAAVEELVALASTPDAPPPDARVLCGVTGGGDRAGARDRMAARGVSPEAVIDLAPGELLRDGLPYGRSRVAVILDADPTDVPERYLDPELARRLVSVVADAVARGGIVVCPAGDAELHDLVREAGCRVALFSVDGAVARLHGGRIVLEMGDTTEDAGELTGDATPAAQLAAALAARSLRERPEDTDQEGMGDGAAGEQR
jgi:hypothetical protein